MKAKILILLMSFVVMSSAANAAIIFGNNGTNTTVTLTNDITFLATGSSDNFTRFIFEDAFSTEQTVQIGGTISNTIGVSINGVAFTNPSTGSVWGGLSFDLNEWDTNDFGMSFSESFNFNAGDTVVLTSGTAVLNASASFMPDLMPLSVVLVSNSAFALSERVILTPVEASAPATLATFMLGAFVLFKRRAK
ncbi:hypothetical protein [Glaciecola petra]|uniref:PEP-CTERM protein-sorting domain-containing protein n=1 Tax=Glaciecola petra TaxID=3075602 RepID=A0ABU2ZTN7_9ALTE|nr:hypothetical protein [Aestuariibacter sp. P117]MDT0595403.1 hypothetical protein [Aestuariibacter sp. P117]